MAQLQFTAAALLALMAFAPMLVSSQPVAPDHAKQMENIANLAEKMSDRQREKYCERFGEKIASRVDVWPHIMTECIDKLVFDRANAHLPENFPVVTEEMSKKIEDIHRSCSSLVNNPCVGDDWKNVKKCIRDNGMKVDVLNAGQAGAAMPKNMPTISLGIASSIFECTAAHFDNPNA